MRSKIEVFIDGASSGNPGPAGCGVVIKEEQIIREISCFIGYATNNVAEYMALIIALEEVRDKVNCDIIISSDSELIVRQMNGQYKVKDEGLVFLYQQAKRRWRRNYSLVHVPREKNRLADSLARRAVKLAHLVEQGGRLF